MPAAAARRSMLPLAAVTALIALALDQGSKLWVLEVMAMRWGEAREIVSGILTFILSRNYGINFGIGASDSEMVRWALVALSVGVAVAMMVWAARRAPRDALFAVGAGLVAGGALGNGVDRARLGAVTDFLNVTCCGIDNPFAFNVADVWIFAGVALLLWRTSGDGKRTTP